MKKAAVLITVLALGLVASACSEGVHWTPRERDNATHLQASLQATSDAAATFNEIDSADDYRARRGELLQNLRAAHLHAATVTDNVLDKLHPQLYVKFRLGYQKALARMIAAYEADDLDAAATAAGDVREFMEWYRANNHRFRWWEEAMPG